MDRLSDLLRERNVLHAAEPPVPQLDPGQGKTKKAYLWAYRSNALTAEPPILVFDYQSGRHGIHVRNFLAGWQGHLMVDDYVLRTRAKSCTTRKATCSANASNPEPTRASGTE